MTEIIRNVSRQSRDQYDLIIIGSGIYGLMLLLEATQRNLQVLLIEERDFGGQTSLNHLRTVHGGLRYLQSLDINRFMESVRERKWFLQHFPQFVRVMPCLMPLYKKGLKRVSILKLGILLNDLLSINRNRGIHPEKRIPACRIVKPETVMEIFPGVLKERLEGAAIWYDGSIEEYQRLFMEILKFSIQKGNIAINYLKVSDILLSNKKVQGVIARDMVSGQQYEFRAPVIINASGPWSRQLASHFDKDYFDLFPKRLLNWNVLFKREALSDYSLGLTSKNGKEHTFFFHNWKNRLLIGTGELIVEKSDTECKVPVQAMEKFINDINSIVPGLEINEKDILRVYSGILPAKGNGKLAVRETIIDHARHKGPAGLFSVSGVKFTTSRLVAEKTLKRIFPRTEKIPYGDNLRNLKIEDAFFEYNWHPDKNENLDVLTRICKSESVVHLSDLIMRRTSIGDNPERTLNILGKIRELFDWSAKKWQAEVELLKKDIDNFNVFKP